MNEQPMPEITIGLYEPGDEHAIIECFKTVFGVERALEHWQWKFGDCPYGIHCFLGKTPTGQVVAQFTGIPTPHKVGDGTYTFCQMIDSMVDPAFRKGLKKPGLFASTVYDYVDHFGHEQEEAIMYGLPNPQAFRIGRRLLGYSFIHDIIMLHRSAAELAAAPTAAAGAVTVELVERFGADADTLWQAYEPSIEVSLRRTGEYLDWRYADCPDVTYGMFVARGSDGAARGLAVARGEFIGTQDAVLCEWVVPPGDDAAAQSLLAAVEGQAQTAGASGLMVLFPEYAPEFAWFESRGYQKQESQFIQVARSYTDHVPLDLLKEKWFYTLGDYDLV